MSRRKDRERLLAAKQTNPDYPGFRGYDKETRTSSGHAVTSAVCSVCGRRRNIPAGQPPAPGEPFVCLSCQEERAQAAPPEPTATA